MTFDDPVVQNALVDRFGGYFAHPNPDHHTLQVADRAAACRNVRYALACLGVSRSVSDDPLVFDAPLSAAVRKFQQATSHRSVDGLVGPGTRTLLVLEVLKKYGIRRFEDLDSTDVRRNPTVFLSYAWVDSRRVDKLDQWLRDHGVRVIRDVDAFKAGSNISEDIKKSVLSSDKVVAVYSEASKSGDWPGFERQIAEQVEGILKEFVLIYLRLDRTPMKAHDPNRISIDADGKPLKEVGEQILHSLGMTMERPRHEYDENEPL